MKKNILIVTAISLFMANSVFGQDIPHHQVPSVILNNFKSDFPKASDIEWEKEGDLYKVDFEIGWNTDHEIWYEASGDVVKHKEDISKSELPKAVSDRIHTDFDGYSIDDLKRITTASESETIYFLELNSFTQDWEVTIDSNGKVLNQIAD